MTNFEKYMKNEHSGKENAIKSKTLEAIFQCKGREIRHTVNELRCLGVPICSCSQGYYYSTSTSDIQETIDHLAGRVRKIKAAQDGMEKSLPQEVNAYEDLIN